jgi:intein/homing endonuclease
MTEITNIIVAPKADRIYFNNDNANKFTETHPIFIKRNLEYRVVEAANVVEGDIIISINPSILHELVTTQEVVSEITVTSVTKETIDLPKDVYTFSCEPYNWYFAGNILTHNK